MDGYIGNSDYTTEVTLHPLTEEGRRKIRHYIESAQPYDLRYQPVIDIISEEVGYYFTRQKNIDDIIEIIEKRVNLYLEERG